MINKYDKFKLEIMNAQAMIKDVEQMEIVSIDFVNGFNKAMYKAGQIYLKIEKEQVNE